MFEHSTSSHSRSRNTDTDMVNECRESINWITLATTQSQTQDKLCHKTCQKHIIERICVAELALLTSALAANCCALLSICRPDPSQLHRFCQAAQSWVVGTWILLVSCSVSTSQLRQQGMHMHTNHPKIHKFPNNTKYAQCTAALFLLCV